MSIDVERPEWIDLAADIRAVDGNHDLGAGALAAALTARGWTKRAAEYGTDDRPAALTRKRSEDPANEDEALDAALMLYYQWSDEDYRNHHQLDYFGIMRRLNDEGWRIVHATDDRETALREALVALLPSALADVDDAGSTAADWIGSEYVDRLAGLIVERLVIRPRALANEEAQHG